MPETRRYRTDNADWSGMTIYFFTHSESKTSGEGLVASPHHIQQISCDV